MNKLTNDLRIMMLFITALFLLNSVFMPIKVLGTSMMPTYLNGEFGIASRLAYVGKMPERGDVVTVKDSDGELLIKRIIAVPGEWVGISHGVVYVNGRPLQDTFSRMPENVNIPHVRLGQDEVFYLGDNRKNTVFGKAPRERILAKVLF